MGVALLHRGAALPATTALSTRRDAVTFLSIYVLLLFGLPSRYVFEPLGGAGTPAQVLGMAAMLWWIAHWLDRPYTVAPTPEPIRRAMLVFIGAILASYVAATVRPIDPIELRAADRGLLMLVAWLGILLVAGEGIPSRARLDQLLRRLALGGGLIATLGIAQFETGLQLTNYLRLPGLTENGDLHNLVAREGFIRPSGTAVHPIEFGVVLTMILPIALHYALFDTRHKALRRWYPVVAIAFAIAISVSRSAIIGTIVVLACLIPTWPAKVRRIAVAVCACFTAFVYVLVPGMLGTVTGLFLTIGNDTSARSRTDSYGLAAAFVSRAPLVGRGFSTFLPDYRILDNQYLGLLIEAGIIGLLALLVLLITALSTAMKVRRRSRDPSTRHLAQALFASLAAGSVGLALFDAFSFPMVPGLLFLMLGIVASLGRLHMAGRPEITALSTVGRRPRAVPAPPSTAGPPTAE